MDGKKIKGKAVPVLYKIVPAVKYEILKYTFLQISLIKCDYSVEIFQRQ